MACESMRRPNQTVAERKAAIKVALKKLEAQLTAGQVKVVIGPQGAVAFTGWMKEDSDGVVDACAYRTLTAEGSWALKQAVMKAEAMSGRKVNQGAVAAGYHTHDGKTWEPGHGH